MPSIYMQESKENSLEEFTGVMLTVANLELYRHSLLLYLQTYLSIIYLSTIIINFYFCLFDSGKEENPPGMLFPSLLCVFFSVHGVYEWVLSAFAQEKKTARY